MKSQLKRLSCCLLTPCMAMYYYTTDNIIPYSMSALSSTYTTVGGKKMADTNAQKQIEGTFSKTWLIYYVAHAHLEGNVLLHQRQHTPLSGEVIALYVSNHRKKPVSSLLSKTSFFCLVACLPFMAMYYYTRDSIILYPRRLLSFMQASVEKYREMQQKY